MLKTMLYVISLGILALLLSACSKDEEINNSNPEDRRAITDAVVEENHVYGIYASFSYDFSQKATLPRKWLLGGYGTADEVWCMTITGYYSQGGRDHKMHWNKPYIVARYGDSWKATIVEDSYYPDGTENAFLSVGCDFDRERLLIDIDTVVSRSVEQGISDIASKAGSEDERSMVSTSINAIGDWARKEQTDFVVKDYTFLSREPDLVQIAVLLGINDGAVSSTNRYLPYEAVIVLSLDSNKWMAEPVQDIHPSFSALLLTADVDSVQCNGKSDRRTSKLICIRVTNVGNFDWHWGAGELEYGGWGWSHNLNIILSDLPPQASADLIYTSTYDDSFSGTDDSIGIKVNNGDYYLFLIGDETSPGTESTSLY